MSVELEVTRVKSVEPIEGDEFVVYDIGMVDNPHTFFANDILVHNSVFYPAEPIVKAGDPLVDTEDDDVMTERILKVADEVQQFINNCYDLFARRLCSIQGKHFFEIKQELIARSGLWIKKKRYAQWIINAEGHQVDKLDVKGLDIVRSDFPPAFKEVLEDVIISMLHGIPQEKIDEKILEFRSKLKETDLINIARPTGVKGVDKYGTDEFGRRQKGTPAHVKSVLTYNDLIDYFGLDKHYSKLKSGEKIKWIYLTKNKFGFSEVAFRGFDDPPEIMEFIAKYADYEKVYENELKSKLEGIYEAVGWDFPSENRRQAKKFFAFG